MLNHNMKMESTGEQLKANLKYDLTAKFDIFDFFKRMIKKDIALKNLIKNRLNKKITHDDQL